MANLITNSSAFLEPLEYNNRTDAEKAHIDALITAGSEYIERKCNRVFAATDYTDEKHDGQGWPSIFVDNLPLNTLTDIDIIHSRSETSSSSTTFDADKFELNNNTGEIQFKSDTFLTDGGGNFPEGFRNVHITYNGGFTTIPFPVQELTADYVIQSFDPMESVELVEKEKIGDYFVAKAKNYFDKMPFMKKQILASYRIRRIFQ